MDASDIRGMDDLGNLIEAARCLGLVQARKAFGQYGPDDAASERGLHASISERSARLRAEVEALKATLTQQCKGFRADVEKLEAEVEALRADAALKRDLLLWALYHAQGGSSRVGQAIRRHLGIEQHAHLTAEQIQDAARATQGDKT